MTKLERLKTRLENWHELVNQAENQVEAMRSVTAEILNQYKEAIKGSVQECPQCGTSPEVKLGRKYASIQCCDSVVDAPTADKAVAAWNAMHREVTQ